jgi:hypothetical protein
MQTNQTVKQEVNGTVSPFSTPCNNLKKTLVSDQTLSFSFVSVVSVVSVVTDAREKTLMPSAPERRVEAGDVLVGLHLLGLQGHLVVGGHEVGQVVEGEHVLELHQVEDGPRQAADLEPGCYNTFLPWSL